MATKNTSASCDGRTKGVYLAAMKTELERWQVEDAARLKALFNAKTDKSQQQFGLDHDLGSQGMVWQYLNAKRALNVTAALKFAQGLGVAVTAFSPTLAKMLAQAPTGLEIKELPASYQGERKVPVVGTAQLGDEGYFVDLEYPVGNGDGFIKWPSKDGNAYAVRCRGESMRPRIKSGEYVVVEPGREVRAGDEVLVKDKTGRVMVKEFLYIRDGAAHLGSINEAHPRIIIPMADVEVMHYVAGIAKGELHVGE